MINSYKVLTKQRAKGLEDSNISRTGLCNQLARCLIQKELLNDLIGSATIEHVPEAYNALLQQIQDKWKHTQENQDGPI